MAPRPRDPAVVAAHRGTEVELFSVAGHDGHLREVNDAFARLLGLTVAEVDGSSLLEFVHPDDLAVVVAGLAALEGGAPEVLLECRFLQRDGRGIHLQWVARPLQGGDLWWAAGRDTTEFHRLLAERGDLRARLDLATGTATTTLWELDFQAGTLSWEAQASVVLGTSEGSAPATAEELAAAVHPDDADAVLVALRQLADAGSTEVALRVGSDAATRYLSLRGRVLDRDRRGRPLRAVGLVLDVTTEKAMEDQMIRMVMSDALTGAPNRRGFDQSLRGEWRRSARSRTPLSIIMVDIDAFKRFNDTFGHLVGDEALCAVSRALSATVGREGDLVARFGGEEFAVVLPGADSAGALTVAGRMLEAVRAIELRQAPGWPMSVSIGTATRLPETELARSSELLSRADEALYAAKTSGKDRAVAYEQHLAARDGLQLAIARGLAEGEFVLHYQPVIDLRDCEVAAFEALMRWDRPGHGLLGPGAFIPVAEGSDLICDLGRWALREAASQLATWSRAGLDAGRELRMAVNASARHVELPAIVADVAAALDAAGLPARRLEIEVTETAFADETRLGAQLVGLRALGVGVAIDDFGTGTTSIGQIPRLAADTLKIDRSFVGADDPRQRALVPLMILAAHASDLRVVAEGIEDDETLQAMRALGCDAAQGFLMARPLPASDVPSWLAQWRARDAAVDAA